MKYIIVELNVVHIGIINDIKINNSGIWRARYMQICFFNPVIPDTDVVQKQIYLQFSDSGQFVSHTVHTRSLAPYIDYPKYNYTDTWKLNTSLKC